MRILVIGAGLAGWSITHFLAREGCKVTIADFFENSSASKVAAGIMNPITGRRKVLSYNVKQLLPFAFEHYSYLEKESGIPVLHQSDIIHPITSIADLNDWQSRSGDSEYCNYIVTSDSDSVNIPGLLPYYGYVRLKQGGFISSKAVIDAYYKIHSHQINLINKYLTTEDLEFQNNLVLHDGMEFEHVIFCEGFRVLENPLFNFIPFQPVKGEMVDIYAPDLCQDCVINGDVYLVPAGNGNFRVGATYVWDQTDDGITTEGLIELEKGIRKTIDVDFKIINHYAGIRPAIKDRRPVIGKHSVIHNAAIFNGLGTKGALMSPFYAKQLSDLIYKNKPVDADVSINRFQVS